MKKKVIGVLLTGMLAFSITACGGSDEAGQGTSGETTPEVPETVVAVGEPVEEDVEVSKEVQDALAQAAEEETQQSSGIVNTVYGNFNGFYDDDSIEVLVDDEAVEYTLGNEEVKAEVGNYKEGEEIVFEAQVDTKVITDIVEVGAITEPPVVTLTEEEAASGIVVGQLMRYENDTTMVVKVGEEEVSYVLSAEAQQDIYDSKVNFGYDLKFQTETKDGTQTIVNFIYE